MIVMPGYSPGLATLLFAMLCGANVTGCAQAPTAALDQPAAPKPSSPAAAPAAPARKEALADAKAGVAGKQAAADKEAGPACQSLEACGIQVQGVRLSAANYMLDFRYKVVDADKAARFINPRMKTYLEVESNGARMLVPSSSKVGALRQTRSKIIQGRSYFVFFANPGHYVKAGEKVRVVMGDLVAGNLTVQ